MSGPPRSSIERGSGDPEVDLLSHDPRLRAVAAAALDFDRHDFGRRVFALREPLLLDDHGPVRAAAADRLARAGRVVARLRAREREPLDEVTQWLREALADPLPTVREASCRALAALADGERPSGRAAAADLTEATTRDPIWWVRRAAVRAVAAIAGAGAIERLLLALDDPFWRVRHGVVQALALIVDRSPEADRPRLRARIFESAAALELDEAARAALAYLASGWPEGETEVAAKLGRVPDPGAGLELADADPAVVTARLIAAAPGSITAESLIPLLAESHVPLRDEALRRLATVTTIADIEALRPALAWLEDPRVPTAPAAVRRLLDRLGTRARPLVEAAFAAGGPGSLACPGALAWAIAWVGVHPAEDLHAAVLAHRQHPRPAVRRAVFETAARVLRRERGRAPAFEAALVDGLRDPDLRLCGVAARGLLEVGRVGPVRIEIWRTLAPRVRAASLPSLPVEVAQVALTDADGRVRAAAVTVLGSCAHDRARDSDPLVRAAAMTVERALSPLATAVEARRAAELLLRAKRGGSTDPRLRDVARRWSTATDPGLRAAAMRLADDADLDLLLLATRDRSPRVRLAADARLARVPDLAARLEARLDATAESPASVELRIAAWSSLLLGAAALDPETAWLRLQRARATVGEGEVRAHLDALAVALDPSPPPARVTVRDEPRPALDLVAPAGGRRPLGRTGIDVAPLIVSGVNELAPSSLARAAERGVDTFFWEPSYRNLSRFLRQPARARLQVVAGSFHGDRAGLIRDVETARRRLRRDHIDVFLVFWVRSPARLGPEVLATLRECQHRGWIRGYGLSTHERAIACEAMASGDWPIVMTRHSAAHTGAEREVLPTAVATSTGVLGFSALCYGRMLQGTSVLPRGPRAVDCYRYSLVQPGVAACVSAPRRHVELAENLGLLGAEGLSELELEVLRAHGREVYADRKRFDRLIRRGGSAPLREAILELFEQARRERDGRWTPNDPRETL